MGYRISPCARQVRRYDRDRFLFTLFAPSEIRQDIYTILAFNSEISRIRYMVSDPLVGKLRLAWWQDAVETIYENGKYSGPHHYILDHLSKVIVEHEISKLSFDRLFKSRMLDFSNQPFKDEETLIDYAYGTSGVLNIILLRVVGINEVLGESVSELGIAWALIGLMRALPSLAKLTYSPLSETLIPSHQGSNKFDPKLGQAVESVCRKAETFLMKSRLRQVSVPKEDCYLFLSSILATHYLKQFAKVSYNPYALEIKPGGVSQQLRILFGILLGDY